MTPGDIEDLLLQYEADVAVWTRAPDKYNYAEVVDSRKKVTALLEAKAPTEATGLQDKIARAYGYLWHVNNSGVGFQFSPEKAAHMARRVLRDTLTHEQRGNAINMAATELFEIIRNSHHE